MLHSFVLILIGAGMLVSLVMSTVGYMNLLFKLLHGKKIIFATILSYVFLVFLITLILFGDKYLK